MRNVKLMIHRTMMMKKTSIICTKFCMTIVPKVHQNHIYEGSQNILNNEDVDATNVQKNIFDDENDTLNDNAKIINSGDDINKRKYGNKVFNLEETFDISDSETPQIRI